MILEIYDEAKKAEKICRLALVEDDDDINIVAIDEDGDVTILFFFREGRLHRYNQACETEYGFKLNKDDLIWIEGLDSE